MKQASLNKQKTALQALLDCRDRIKQQIVANNLLQQQVKNLVKNSQDDAKTRDKLMKAIGLIEKHAIKKEEMEKILLQLDKVKAELNTPENRAQTAESIKVDATPKSPALRSFI